MKHIPGSKSLAALVLLGLILMAPAAPAASPSYLPSLRQGLQQGLENLDAHLVQAAREIGSLGIRNPKVNDVLRLVLVGQSFTISCSIISAGGFMVAVEPAEFSRLENYNLRATKDRPQTQASREPTLTKRFPTAEGGWAVALTQPINDEQGKFLGWLSLLIDPVEMMVAILDQAPPPSGREVWLAQSDGVLLYHPQAAEVGRNLGSDPSYQGQPAKAELGRRLSTEAEGESQAAKAQWLSLGLHGAAWRLLLVRPEG